MTKTTERKISELGQAIRCRACKRLVRTRKQWLAEKCPAFTSGKSGHLIPAPGRLRHG